MVRVYGEKEDFKLSEEDIGLILEYLPNYVRLVMCRIIYRQFSSVLYKQGYNVEHLLKLTRISRYNLNQE